jgi:hypothetical protein
MSVTLSKGYVEAAKKHGEEIRKTLCPNAQRISQLIRDDFVKQNPMPSILHEDGSIETAF